MSYIGKNIRKIRHLKGLNQSQFAELLGLTRASIGAYEEGRAEPKISTIIDIANHFSISVDLLLKKELKVNELSRFDIFADELASGKGKSYERQQPTSIPIVVPKAFPDYVKEHSKEEFISTLPSIESHPMVIRGERLFEVDTQALANETGDIREGDLLVCGRIDPTRLDRIEEGQVHVVVTSKEVSIRRVRVSGKSLELFTNHPDYPPVQLAQNKVVEVWKAQGVISYQLHVPSATEDRLVQLEKTVAELVNQMKSIQK